MTDTPPDSPWKALGNKVAKMFADAIDEAKAKQSAHRATITPIVTLKDPPPSPPNNVIPLPRNLPVAALYTQRYLAVVMATRFEVLRLLDEGAISEEAADLILDALKMEDSE